MLVACQTVSCVLELDFSFLMHFFIPPMSLEKAFHVYRGYGCIYSKGLAEFIGVGLF